MISKYARRLNLLLCVLQTSSRFSLLFDCSFCPALTVISDALNLSPNVAVS